jgi:sulfur-oxidizing protein SoxX
MKPYKLALIPVSLLAMTSIAFAAEVGPGDVVFADGAVAASLTGVAGDAANGRKVFANRKLGNCLACHVNSEMSEQSFHGAGESLLKI